MSALRLDLLDRFVAESNRIEGIHRDPTAGELSASFAFLDLDSVRVEDLKRFVSACQPGAKLRTRPGMDVYVGNHRPPPGGPTIETELKNILMHAQSGLESVQVRLPEGFLVQDGKLNHPFHIHQSYETLHPFMDGNGRSGRILWAWQMLRQGIRPGLALGFLHAHYYQSLEFSR